MAFQPKTEDGSPLASTLTTHKNYEHMTISELVLFLRTAYREEDFDKVEEELVKRDAELKAQIGSLREKMEEERLVRTEAQEKLKRREEQCEKGKRTKENYENLLKEVKKNGSLHKNTVEELRQKNIALERENCELKVLKKKWVDGGNAVAELRIKIGVLEKERVGDKSDLDALRMKNSELEEAVKKGLKIKEELITENCKLAHEKRRRGEMIESMERKFRELSVRVVKLEDDTKLLMRVEASGCGNTEVEPDPGVTCAVKDEEDVGDYELENDTGGHVPLQRSEDTRHSLGAATAQSPSIGNKDALGASAGEILEMKNVIEIIDLDDDDDDDDDDDVGCTSQGLHRKKVISQIIAENEHPISSDAVQHKRKCVSVIETSTSTSSSADTFNEDNFPSSSRAIAGKRSKTSADSFELNSAKINGSMSYIKYPY